jgi:hypothetical protein
MKKDMLNPFVLGLNINVLLGILLVVRKDFLALEEEEEDQDLVWNRRTRTVLGPRS